MNWSGPGSTPTRPVPNWSCTSLRSRPGGGAKRLEARVAISFSAPGAEAPSLGAFEIEGDTEVDLDTRLVNLSAVEIVKHRFPALDEEQSQKLLAKLEELMPQDEVIIALDRVLASLERGEVQGRAVETKTTPPQIFVSHKPAVLVLLDGKPIWAKIKDNALEFAVNTNWDLFRMSSSSTFYLRNEDAWLKTSNLEGPWLPARKLPKAFKKLPKDNDNWKDVRESPAGQEDRGLRSAQGLCERGSGRTHRNSR